MVALGAWAGLIAAAVWWGERLTADGMLRGLRAAPLYGRWDPAVSWRVVPAVAVAAVVVWWGPGIAVRLRWPAMLAATAATTVVWSVTLALVDGVDALTSPLESRHEYLPLAHRVGDLGTFVDTFVERIRDYPTHVRGHPPGMVVLLGLLDRIGLGAAGWAATLVIGGAAIAVVATLVLTRELAGAPAARRAAPFVTVLPAAIWLASTADALFAGVGLAGVALASVATRRDAVAPAVASGVLLGCGVHLSYGLVLLAPLVVAVVARRWSMRAAAGIVIGGLAVTAGFLLAGFAWWEGLAATHGEYARGIAADRPYGYSLVGTTAALALATGPSVAVGLALLRGRLRWVVVPALVAIGIAALSGLAKGEVERIWLFLVPPLAAAAAGVVRPRALLALQVTAAVVLAVLLRSPW